MPLHRCSIVSVLFAFVLATSSHLFSLDEHPVSDPQAVALAQQGIASLTNGFTVNDAILTGNATWIAGSDTENGPATLQVKGTGESRVDLNLSSGMRTEIRNDSSGSPQGESVLQDGSRQQWALHNCQVNASWFFPALSILAATSDPSLIFTYIGSESRGDRSVLHIQAYRYLSGRRAGVIALTQAVSTEDIYLDAASMLPTAFVFNTHPDDDALTNISLEIDFSNYQSVNGVLVPMHVQKLISGGLAVDINITGVILNSGLTDSPFVIQ